MTAKTKTAKVEPVVLAGNIEITLPPKPVRSGNGGKYPFDALEVGGYFAIKNKDRRSMAGAITNANKRYRNELKDETGKVINTVQEREFYAADVDAATATKFKGTPLEGSTVLIIRSA